MRPLPRCAAAVVSALALALGACSKTGESADAGVAVSAAPSSIGAADAASPASPLSSAIVREATVVLLDGVTETWRLEWKRPPFPTCRGEEATTCACTGFTPGERGDLALVRARPGVADERLELSPLFDGHEAILATAAADGGAAVLTLGDYDHDGRASELVFQVGAGPCGHTASVLIGLSKVNPHLHAFTSAESPKEPLTLERRSDWETLRAKGSFDAVQIRCGDHGADESTSVSVRAASGVLHASEKTTPCTP